MVAPRDQRFTEMAADETGAAGYEHFKNRHLFLLFWLMWKHR
jgi:hypothetical protein